MNTPPQFAQQEANAPTFLSNSSNQAKANRRAPSNAQPKSKRRTTSTMLSKSKATTKMPRKRKASRSQFKSDIAPENAKSNLKRQHDVVDPDELEFDSACVDVDGTVTLPTMY